MAAFHEPWKEQPLDWLILQNSPIASYFRPDTLENDIAWFVANGYRIVRFSCPEWTSTARFHEDAAKKFEFPAYYGRNLAAFEDCLSDLDMNNVRGTLVVFDRFDTFAHRDRSTAETILDILAQSSRFHSLLGQRLVVLVQSDDPNIRFGPIGGCAVEWNPKEWPGSSRGL